MPRWDAGWGVQFVEEYRAEDQLLNGKSSIGSGFSERIHILHAEGVYTWDRSIRITAKLPLVLDARRKLPSIDGGELIQRDSGLGDLTLALPLKQYFNLDGRSGSWTFAPQVRIPLASRDSYDVYDRAWGQGVSLGYETETYNWLAALSVSGWIYYADEPFESHTSLKLGTQINAFDSSGHILVRTIFHREDDDSATLSVGPLLYWRFSDEIHGQMEWQHDVYDRQGTLDHGNGYQIKIGIGFVY